MTALAKRKTKLQFETAAIVRSRPIIVECDPRYATIRPKGLRISYRVPWESIYLLGEQMEGRYQGNVRNACYRRGK